MGDVVCVAARNQHLGIEIMSDPYTQADASGPATTEEPVTHETGVITIDDEDEGYQQSETSSLLSSIESDIKKGKVENGRIYATYGKHGDCSPASSQRY